MKKRSELEVSKNEREARRRVREEGYGAAQAAVRSLFQRLTDDLDDNVYRSFINQRDEACLEAHPIDEPDIGFLITSDGLEGEVHEFITFDRYWTARLTPMADSQQEGKEALRELLAVGRAYLIQRPVPSGRYFPKITVEMPEREEVMRHPLNDDLARLISFRWLKSD